METKHRKRGENWTGEEREIFIDIMKDSVRIIECKNTDTNTNKRKQAEWQKVQKKFQELTGKLRDVVQLKGLWRRMRLVVKKNRFQRRRALHATGGGEKPPSPFQEEQKIMEMCPTDFRTEENEFDSDIIFHKETGARIASMAGSEIRSDVQQDIGNKENVSTPHKTETKRSKPENSYRATLVKANIDLKEKTMRLLEEEYALKLRYHRQELCHQKLRHQLEIDILLIEKEKKEFFD